MQNSDNSIPTFPLISVITVTKNDDENLSKTLKSFRNQSYPNLELIVVDGASIDKTLDVINSNLDIINTWVSEPDSGIYYAMNKGLDLARGSGILFLNSGDYFEGDVLQKNIRIPCIFGCRIINGNGGTRIKKFGKVYLGMPTSHQCIVFEKSAIRFSTKYSISSDYEYSLNNGVFSKAYYYPESFIIYDNSGMSNQKYWARDVENLRIIYNYFGSTKAAMFLIFMSFKGVIKLFLRLWY